MWELFALWPAPLGPRWDSHGSCVGVARPSDPTLEPGEGGGRR